MGSADNDVEIAVLKTEVTHLTKAMDDLSAEMKNLTGTINQWRGERTVHRMLSVGIITIVSAAVTKLWDRVIG